MTHYGEDGYLSLKSLAVYAGMSLRTLRSHLTHPSHPLPHYRVGGKLLVRRGEFDMWMRTFKVDGPPRLEAIVADALRTL